MTGTSLTKPWTELGSGPVPAQLGVFQLADADQRVLHTGYGGGREPFGLHSAVEAAVAASEVTPRYVRWEVTHGYLSRWRELVLFEERETGDTGETGGSGRWT